VYPILRRLEVAALLKSSWEGTNDAHAAGRPPRRYYTLTGAGAAAAREAVRRYPRIAQVVGGADIPSPVPA
jgi:DNA-binding PadR family transcriptional regulator